MLFLLFPCSPLMLNIVGILRLYQHNVKEHDNVKDLNLGRTLSRYTGSCVILFNCLIHFKLCCIFLSICLCGMHVCVCVC